ncbi:MULTISPECIES: pyridoxal-phosphate dependent enzyme [Streptomyces]|uniref:pyridoxal-phosphate dependent enzyme n=1 Tax=Streptomyces TaxID=1883 RepID=UPI0004DA5D27|nr:MULTISPECIES: pyridoxal-phosphate dependent enzyme [Streptomyces]OFA34214.1 hypothetical protein BEN35_30805 [Streptomyces fradiae]
MTPTVHDIEATLPVLSLFAGGTPVHHCPEVDQRLGRRLFVKLESRQPGGSFKVRGLIRLLAGLPQHRLDQGVIGRGRANFVRALGWAGRRYGVPVTAVVPDDVPASLVRDLLACGARPVFHPAGSPGAGEAVLAEQAGLHRLTVVRPGGRHAVIGAGTVAWEMLRQVPDLATLILPLGSGSLAAGSALVARGRRRGVRVVGVAPARSLTVSSAPQHRIAAGTAGSRQARALDSADPDPMAGELAARLLDERVTVADEDIRRAVGVYAREYRQTAEPSGALALAAVLSGRVRPAPGPVGVVLSGGNVMADAGGRPALTTGRKTPRAPGAEG